MPTPEQITLGIFPIVPVDQPQITAAVFTQLFLNSQAAYGFFRGLEGILSDDTTYTFVPGTEKRQEFGDVDYAAFVAGFESDAYFNAYLEYAANYQGVSANRVTITQAYMNLPNASAWMRYQIDSDGDFQLDVADGDYPDFLASTGMLDQFAYFQDQVAALLSVTPEG